MGYCFLNMVDYRAIVPFVMEFNGQRWSSFNSEKVCSISYARIQGLQSLMVRFKASEIMDKDWEYRPSFFHSSGLELDRADPYTTNRYAGNPYRPPGNYYPAAAAAPASVYMNVAMGGMNNTCPSGHPSMNPHAGLVESMALLNLQHSG